MRKYLLASIGVFTLVAAGALAQTTSSDSTTTTSQSLPTVITPAPVQPPPSGTLSITESKHITDGDGTQVNSTKTTYGNANGAASDSTVTTTTPQPPIITNTNNSSSSTTTN